ncbi:hypothetical protein ILYODFUR_017944, partial [Ilyodon furcidens]
MALYNVPLSGNLMGVLVLGLIFSCYTQRKQPQFCTSKGPLQSHIDHISVEHAVPCCTVLKTDKSCCGDHGFSLKHHSFHCRLQCCGKTTQRRHPLPHLVLKDAVLHDWNCQIKHT